MKLNSTIGNKIPAGFRQREIAGKICVFPDEWEDEIRHLAEKGISAESGTSTGIEFLRGRGRPAVVPFARGKLVVRHYYHGGIFRGLTGDLFIGISRFLNELEILSRARRAGIPVPEPAGLIIERAAGGFYRGDLITVYIEESIDLLTYYRNISGGASLPQSREKREIIERSALRIAALHKAGFYHGDLQLKNLSIRKNEKGVSIFILDFDKAVFGTPDDFSKSGDNLIRLYRSFEKLRISKPHISVYDPIRFIRSYAPKNPEFRKNIINKVLQRRWRGRFRLLKWRLTLRLRGSSYAQSMTGS